jgi:hypothetical protein
MLSSLLWIFFSFSHPVFGSGSIFDTPRERQYFRERPALYEINKKLADEVKARRFSNIGLDVGGDDFEYPLWLMLREGVPSLRLEHVNVKNVSAALPMRPFDPAMTLVVHVGEQNVGIDFPTR